MELSGAAARDSSSVIAVLEPSLRRGESVSRILVMIDPGGCDFRRGAQRGRLAQSTDAQASIPDHMNTCTLAATTVSEKLRR